MKKGLKYYYNHLEASIIIACLAVTTVLVFIQVVMRYVFNSSLLWSEEVARYLFIWESWLGVSLAARTGEHIAVEMLTSKLTGLCKCAVGILADAVVFLICAIMTWQGALLVMKMAAMQSVSPVLHLPMAYCYAAVPVGCGLMLLRSIESAAKRIRDYRGLDDSGKGAAET